MKISDEEINAAHNAWAASKRGTFEGFMRDALEAARRVRKARKAAKRAKAKPSLLDNELAPEPAAPAWNGKFEVGKAYRTRSGQKATIDSRLHQLYTGVYPLVGQYRNEPWSWMECGRADITKETPRDIVGPWED
jgi:hypothetical protein